MSSSSNLYKQYAVSILMLILAYSCKSNSIEEKNQEPFTISVARGGGFTGIINGFTLKSTGDIVQWRRLITGKDTTLSSNVDDLNKILHYKNKLLTIGVLEFDHQTTGNITNYLSYSNSDTTYNWSWKDNDEKVSEELKNWFNEVNEYCKSIN